GAPVGLGGGGAGATGGVRGAGGEGAAAGGGAGGSAGGASDTPIDPRPTEPALGEALAREDSPENASFVLLALAAIAFYGGTSHLLLSTARRTITRRVAAICALAGVLLWAFAALRG